MATFTLAARFAWRELRGGIAGFRIFILCLALGVAIIAGVGALGDAIEAGLTADSRALLGGDVEFSLVHRTADDAQASFLAAAGQVSHVAQMRGMARTADGARRSLVEIKAVDGAYPLYGEVTLDPRSRGRARCGAVVARRRLGRGGRSGAARPARHQGRRPDPDRRRDACGARRPRA
jgi:predicted lysophospholipase L1 biosynthesis ABC-type transport system permease subunit